MSRRASPSEPAATAARCARRLVVLVLGLGLTGIAGGPAARAVAVVDTVRYVEIVDGNVLGGWSMWQEGPGTWGYAVDRRYHFERTGRLTLDDDGLPLRMQTSGQVTEDMPWFERFEREGGVARWVTPRARGDSTLTGAAFYHAVYPAYDLGVLARALLRRPSRTLPLLPYGEARLEPLTERTVSADAQTRTVRLHAVHGIDLVPRYVWLDEGDATFADEWSVLAGWEPAFAELRAAMDDAIATYRLYLARALLPPKRTRPLVIRGASLFDAQMREVRPGTSIVIDGSHIVAVGPDDEIDAPADSEVIDAAGRMVLPGLWDMHAHLSMPAHDDAIFDRGHAAPLHLAAGVTTVRDVGSHVGSLLTLRSAIEADSAIGPRIVGAGFIDSDETHLADIGVLVGTKAEARAAVDGYAEHGFRQVKLHAYLPPELVEVVVERARQRGLRVSGHIVTTMTAQDAVEAGYDEIQHLWWLLWGVAWTYESSVAAGETWQTWHQLLAELTPDSEPVREIVALLAERDVAVDATLGYFASEGTPPDFIADQVHRFPAPVRRLLEHTAWQPNYFPRSPLARPAREQALTNMFELLRTLHEAGVLLIIGSDTWAGFGLHYELEMFARAGIPAPEVLALATLGAARVMGMDDELGSIEPDKLADLILVDGDPTTDIGDVRRVVTVIKEGRIYDPAAIYRALGIEPCCKETSRRYD